MWPSPHMRGPQRAVIAAEPRLRVARMLINPCRQRVCPPSQGLPRRKDMVQLPGKINTPAGLPALVVQGRAGHRARENPTRRSPPRIENLQHEKKNSAGPHSVLVFL